MKKIILLLIILLASILRFYKLGEVPPSLYWDEVSLGYNAYSILQTARDEHGVLLPVTNFAAYGDYKPPLYIYGAVPAIAIFGLTEFAVRFPSALFGVLTVLTTYFLAKKLFEKDQIALISAFFLAISPWHIQFSRGAFEANLGLFFSTLAILLFIKFAKEKSIYIYPSLILFLAGMYTFTGQRLFVPFILLILILQFKKEVISKIRITMTAAAVTFVLFWPLLIFSTQTIEGKLRYDEVSIFKDLDPINSSIEYRERDNFSPLSQVIHNRRLFFLHEYAVNYFDAFNPAFLFFTGDGNPRLSTGEIGQLYYFDFILILAGIYFLIAQKSQYRFLIIGWLLVSPLGPAVARETPHALRMAHILPTFQLISAFGLYSLYKNIRYKRFFVTLSVVIVTISLFYYLHMYYVHYPIEHANSWQYGYKQAVVEVNKYINDADNVVVSRRLGRPYIYFLFHNRFDPRVYWANSNVVKDQFYFIDVKSFDKFKFPDSFTNYPGKNIYVLDPGNLPPDAQKTTTIYNFRGEPIFDIGKNF